MFDGKTVIITGGSSGIGRLLARRLLDRGASLVLMARTESNLFSARDELKGIAIEISVLTPPQDIPGPEAFQVGKHGIILEKQGKRAVFLPQVAPEQGWNREQTLTHLAQKAGLSADAWRKGTRFWVFEAQVFGEKEE